MVSFAAVEKIEGDVIVLHLEMYPEMCRPHARKKWKKTYRVWDELSYVKRFIPDVVEGDVLAVEHSDDCIISYIEKDEEEKTRRQNYLKTLFQKFER